MISTDGPATSDALWHRFVQGGQVEAAWFERMEPAILRSWQRCLPRLAPWAPPRLNRLRNEARSGLLMAHFDLLAIARPIMEDVHQFVEGSGYAVLLSNRTACLLEILGDESAIALLASLGLVPGSFWDEGRGGTGALALAIHEAMPVRVTGSEHYLRAFHTLSAAAAPIHDPRGTIVGAIALAGPAAAAQPHTLGTAMAAARAIGNQLQTDLYLAEANLRLSELNSTFSAITEGLVAWNEEGLVTHINRPASEMLETHAGRARGRPVHDVFPLPPALDTAVREGRRLEDVEISVGRTRPVSCLVSLHPVTSGKGRAAGTIASLRPLEQVRRLVTRMVGARARLTFDDIAGVSSGMARVRRMARVAARATAPILIQGEPGVGKDRLSQAIHNEGERARGPFISVHAGSIPAELMAGEFLGRESGDESGGGRPGTFELADGGTLVLGEIESLSLEMQAALVQLLRTGHVMRLGGTRQIPVDVRILATTAADIERLVAEGRFRVDLYYRLAVFMLEIPPLRERTEDIRPLAERAIARRGAPDGTTARFDEATLARLEAYSWPGNDRELASVIERAAALAEGGIIGVDALPPAVRSGYAVVPGARTPQVVWSLAEAERVAILRAGWACRGRVAEMAERLGTSRTTLWRKMKRLGLSPADFKHRVSPGDGGRL